jgi:hypothetical protein
MGASTSVLGNRQLRSCESPSARKVLQQIEFDPARPAMTFGTDAANRHMTKSTRPPRDSRRHCVTTRNHGVLRNIYVSTEATQRPACLRQKMSMPIAAFMSAFSDRGMQTVRTRLHPSLPRIRWCQTHEAIEVLRTRRGRHGRAGEVHAADPRACALSIRSMSESRQTPSLRHRACPDCFFYLECISICLTTAWAATDHLPSREQ